MKTGNRPSIRKTRLMAALSFLTLAACGLGEESTAMDATGNSPASFAHAYNAAALGYTFDLGIAFKAASVPATVWYRCFRVFNPTSKLHLWTPSANKNAVAAASFGYTVDEGIGFYASPAAGPCLTGVHRLQSAGNHVYSVSTAERDLLVAAGWNDEGIRFYVAPR